MDLIIKSMLLDSKAARDKSTQQASDGDGQGYQYAELYLFAAHRCSTLGSGCRIPAAFRGTVAQATLSSLPPFLPRMSKCPPTGRYHIILLSTYSGNCLDCFGSVVPLNATM